MSMPTPPSNRFPSRVAKFVRVARTAGIVAKHISENPESLLTDSREQIINKAVRKNAYGKPGVSANKEASTAKKDMNSIRDAVADPTTTAGKVAGFVKQAGATRSVGKNLGKMAGKALLKGAKKSLNSTLNEPGSTGLPPMKD